MDYYFDAPIRQADAEYRKHDAAGNLTEKVKWRDIGARLRGLRAWHKMRRERQAQNAEKQPSSLQAQAV